MKSHTEGLIKVRIPVSEESYHKLLRAGVLMHNFTVVDGQRILRVSKELFEMLKQHQAAGETMEDVVLKTICGGKVTLQ